MPSPRRLCSLLSLALLTTLPASVWAGDILSTSGFSSCLTNGTVQVKALDVTYNRDTRELDFNVAGSSSVAQNVTATLVVSAYGREVYRKSFSPCDTGMPEMCPVPAASFASHGKQTIPEQYASQIPAIAFSIPDLDGTVKMEIKGEGGEDIGCISSTVTNGHTLTIPAVSYVAAGIAGAALALSAVSALAAGGYPGATAPSPTFVEVIGWFQGMAMNGMMSVQYPDVYRSFATNFGFSTGLVPWSGMQKSIDNFRQSTGGNLTDASYEYLKNVTLVYTDGSSTSSSSNTKRALDNLILWARDGTEVSVNGTSASLGGDAGNAGSTKPQSKEQHFVSGIESYTEQLTIPKANTFMTILLIWCIIVAAIVVLVLLLKVILEAWSMFGKIPHSMESWRKRYWWRLAKVLTNLILVLYGSWTLYCIYQFTNGDSWAAKLLAGITLGLFTAILGFFTWRIYTKAHVYRQLDGDAKKLYADKETWIKYSLFYENYKHGYWWLFIPTIVYMFARGAIIAGANGHGLVQTGGQLIVEGLMLILLIWTRPYQRPSGVWINIFIQVVRVLSVVCILVFVEELGISQTTKTITGVVLIVVQCVLTGVLAILIAVNALIGCIRENPHRKQRKEAEKLKLENPDYDRNGEDRNSLPMQPVPNPGDALNPNAAGGYGYQYPGGEPKFPITQTTTEYRSPMNPGPVSPFNFDRKGRYDAVPARPSTPERSLSRRPAAPPTYREADEDRTHLVSGAASMGHQRDESLSRSPPRERQPRLPSFDFGSGAGGQHGRAY